MSHSSAKDRTEAGPKRSWDSGQSAEFYGINDWGAGNFDVSDAGDVQVKVDVDGKQVAVPVRQIVQGMRERGLHLPAIVRIRNLLDQRIKVLNESFARAIAEACYRNCYRGVFPIRVNQQCHVVEEVAAYGRNYHHGFEARSKAELIIALSQLQDTEAVVICRGYKDAEYIELGLYARQMGVPCFLLVENLSELSIIIARSLALDIEPLLGVHIKTSVAVDGYSSQDSGDRSIFGLSTTSLIRVVDELRQAGLLHCLRLLHCHPGSQIPDIRNVRSGVLEACQFYAGLVQEGAPMGYLELGGGLALDDGGASTNKMNYGLDEYCANIIETICETLDPLDINHPVIVSESGRATVASASMLLFDILSVSSNRPSTNPGEVTADCPEPLKHLEALQQTVSLQNLQECHKDTLLYRDEIRGLFHHGQATLRERALAEELSRAVLCQIATMLPDLDRVPPELQNLTEQLADVYYGNFSLFQSLPDIWNTDQLLPIMPIHRLTEQPQHKAILADLTCDSGGRIDQFSTPDGERSTLDLHNLVPGEDYTLGIFLIGAYQETLGDLHNLLADTNVVNVAIKPDGSFEFAREIHGDSIADVLGDRDYEPEQLQEKLRLVAERAVRAGKISVAERSQILQIFKESLLGYIYLELR